MATGVNRKKMQLAAFDDASPKINGKRKDLKKIFYASRVITHFVSIFVAMAMGVGGGKMKLEAVDGAFPKTPYKRKNLA